jgi:cytochrome c oxidase subunit 2
MAFHVIAEPRDEFDAWLQNEAEPADSDTETASGLDVFLSSTCIGCHTIRGTEATGTLGPDLTHLGSRLRLAAGTIPNSREDLARWIEDPQSIKPGNVMPPTELSAADLDALLDYLETLD